MLVIRALEAFVSGIYIELSTVSVDDMDENEVAISWGVFASPLPVGKSAPT